MSITVNELEQQIKNLSANVEKELVKLRVHSMTNTTRLEALLRMMSVNNALSYDNYIDYVNSYLAMTKVMQDINSASTITEKVKLASTFNETGLVKIHADDLNILPIIQSTGALSPSLKALVLGLPHTEKFVTSLTQILGESGVPEVSTN